MGTPRYAPLVYADITVTIPRGALALPYLRSVFGGMDQHIGNVFDDVSFGYLTLVGKSITVDVSIYNS